MAWPAGTSVIINGASLNPVPGSGGASWTFSINGTVTLSTGQSLSILHTGNVPAAVATGLQTMITNGVAAEGITLNWP